jgi:ubiquinone/menaquinone biosynthesis C-methylase UbiE
MPIWHAIGQQLQNPRGILGVLTGMLMRVVNATPNHMAVEALEIEPRDRILELGFGPGHAIRLMVPKTPAGFVYGIDQSAVMLQQAAARNRAAIRENRVRLYQAQFENLPFADASFDKILAVNVVYFWADAPAVMREIRRVLRPGGRFCIYATERATMRNWKFAGSQTHRLYDAAALTLALRQAGFEGSQISVRKIRLAAGVQGLLATVS